MRNSKNEKMDFTRLIVTIADQDSNDIDRAKAFLKSKDIDVKQLISDGMQRIREIKLEVQSKEVYSYTSIVKKLTKSGLDNKLLEKIIPERIRLEIKKANNILSKPLYDEVCDYLQRIFKLKSGDLFNEGIIEFDNIHFKEAFFKTSSNPNINQIKAYSHYAFYLAEIVNKVSIKNPKFEYPGDIDEFTMQFYNAYDTLNFSNLVNFAWDLGIAVIPLNDSGVFHGASWNIDNYHVIVLKQKSQSHARWIFDLLHELYHVFVHLENENTTVLEIDEMNPFRENNSVEEVEANTFSNQFIFKDGAESLAKEVINLSRNDMKLLKKSLEIVALKSNVRADFLANYIAFRLQNQNFNWWGTANSFQLYEPSPFIVAAKILKDRISVDRLDSIDKNLLMTAIEY